LRPRTATSCDSRRGLIPPPRWNFRRECPSVASLAVVRRYWVGLQPRSRSSKVRGPR